MFRRVAVRVIDAVRAGPAASMLVMGLLGAVLAATAIAASSQGGGPITAVKVVRETTESSTSSTSYVDVPNARTTITVPSGQRALILARFTAFSYCNAPIPDQCNANVRILIGGVVGAPHTADEFDHKPPGEPIRFGTQSIERSRGGFGGLPAGTYEVKVQAQALAGSLTLGDWHLTVESSRTA